jgi:hypothetical protein
MIAEGKAFFALGIKTSGAGAPPNIRPSSGKPFAELSVRSDTMEGTLRGTSA